MAPSANRPTHRADDPADAAALAGYAEALLAVLDAAVPGWIERSVLERWLAWQGGPPPEAITHAARRAGERAHDEVLPELRDLLRSDVDRQRSNPLHLLRRTVRWATEALEEAGVPPVERDAQAEQLFPGDVYDLAPASFADIGLEVHEPGLVWGAAKAHVIMRRRRSPG